MGLFLPDGVNSTLQSCVNNAALNPRAAVWIPASYAGTDSYTNPFDVPIFDMRNGGSISFGSNSNTGMYAATFTNQTTVVIPGSTHRLNTADLSVSVYDASTGTRNLIFPNSVSIDSTVFDVTVTFVSVQSGRIVLVG